MSSRVDKRYDKRGSKKDPPKKPKKRRANAKPKVDVPDTKDALKLITEIKKLINLADDKLVFGYQEVRDGLTECILESVLHFGSQKNLKKLNTYGCQMVRTSKANMKELGINIIGIKFY